MTTKENKRWYYGTRLGRWYHVYPSSMPEYKKDEGLSDAEFKKLGRKRAKEKVLSPSFFITKVLE